MFATMCKIRYNEHFLAASEDYSIMALLKEQMYRTKGSDHPGHLTSQIGVFPEYMKVDWTFSYPVGAQGILTLDSLVVQTEPRHEISTNVICATNKASD